MNIKRNDEFLCYNRSNVVYQGGYHRTHPVIKWLWQALEQDFTREERALFLRVC